LAVGVTEFDGAETGPLPAALLANTVKVYARPFLSPFTWTGLPPTVIVTLPGFEVTVYERFAAPPVL
jgi:hypothetical protein